MIQGNAQCQVRCVRCHSYDYHESWCAHPVHKLSTSTRLAVHLIGIPHHICTISQILDRSFFTHLRSGHHHRIKHKTKGRTTCRHPQHVRIVSADAGDEYVERLPLRGV